MPDIFKAGIAQKIGAALGPLVFDVTLTVVTVGTRTPGALTAGTNDTEVAYSCKGFVDEYAKSEIDGKVVQQGDFKVSLLGATLPSGVAPAVGDKVTAEGGTYRVFGVRRDPAGAVYECQVR